MKIDGKTIATEIYDDLAKRIRELNQKSIDPTLAIILVGNDPGSENYVRQKQIFAEKIGLKLILDRYHTTTLEELKPIVEKMDYDPKIHGIIIQRPLNSVSDSDLDKLVSPKKDVDAFNPDSPFDPPIARAIIRLLKETHPDNFDAWMKTQRVVVVGKGRTAGNPTIQYLHKLGYPATVIDSKTDKPEQIFKSADIVISAVGKKDAVRVEMLKKGSVLIGVGLHTEDDGKLHGDFNEENIQKMVSFYSPTPRGVGPVNVAMLLENVVLVAEKI